MKNIKRWFPFEGKHTNLNPKNVFCFHHAGGSAAAYRKWTLGISPVKFICVELPGKGTRRNEEFTEDFNRLVDLLVENIMEKVRDEDFYFFGHSMGAAIAFFTAYKMNQWYGKKPCKLIVAGRQAPDEVNLTEFKTYMGDDALIEELRRYKATPLEVLENKDLLNILIPEIRKDYTLNESFQYADEKLDIPIIAHSGKYDYEADVEIMRKWSDMTNNQFTIREFVGDHFFLFDLGDIYKKQLISDILA